MNEFIITLLASLATVYAGSVTVLFRLIREKRSRNRKKFFLALVNGLETESIETLDDVLNVYHGVGTYNYDSEESRQYTGKRLKTFLADLFTGEITDVKKDITPDTIKRWKTIITTWLDELKQETPYSDLPQAERSVLQELDRLIDKKEIEGIKGRVNDLAGMIQLRSEEYNRANRINRWTVPLSIIGLILTLVSTAYGIYYSSKPIRIDTGQIKELIAPQNSTLGTVTKSEPNK
ncbi:MAG: hypothetical protein ACYC3B_08415 [Sedimentisphaerales bacterium]